MSLVHFYLYFDGDGELSVTTYADYVNVHAGRDGAAPKLRRRAAAPDLWMVNEKGQRVLLLVHQYATGDGEWVGRNTTPFATPAEMAQALRAKAEAGTYLIREQSIWAAPSAVMRAAWGRASESRGSTRRH